MVIYHFRFTLEAAVPAGVMAVFDRGYLAVDMFFVLSGFVIGLTYGNWFAQNPGASWGRFAGLRLARIYPLHLFMLLAFLSDPILVYLFSSQGDVGQYSWTYFVQSLALVQAWGFSSGTAWNVPAWSISTEFFVYLIFPIMAFVAARVIRGRWSAFLWIASPFALICAAPVLFGVDFVGDVGRFALVRCVLEFAAGFGVMRLRLMLPPRASVSYLALASGLVILGLVMGGVLADRYAPAAFAALIFALADLECAPARWLSGANPVGRFLLALGAVSYATYLCHYLFRSWVKFTLLRPGVDPVIAFAVFAVMTAIASPLLFLAVERPGRRWGRRVVDMLTGRMQATAS